MPSTTNQPANKPVIFLAFANDRVDNTAYLRNLPIEMDGIRKALQKARQAGLCEVVERANTTVENILDVFQEYRDRIAIFHYGGHADSYELLLESLSGEHAVAHSEGLVSFLARQKGLQMVFINGCCSQQQALDLIEAGVPAVVGTSQKIDDQVATDLSIRFYKGLSAGAGIDRAWSEAIDQIKLQKGDAASTHRGGNRRKAEDRASDQFPWQLYYREGAEVVKQWNLPEAVENPLFGLPDIPPRYHLPESPFLFLRRYEQEHARIFFGRSYYIRDLYNRVSDPKSPPLILLYGQSGAGKSSLFDAGLQPRLEQRCQVCYLRRDPEVGLAGTLELALRRMEKAVETTAEAPPPPEPEIGLLNDNALIHLQAAIHHAEGGLRDEIETLIERLKARQAGEAPPPLPTAMEDLHPLLTCWRSIEAKTGRPLVIILDQAEECFTRPQPDQPDELTAFLRLLGAMFGQRLRLPLGKLILGYRKEYHPEIEAGCKELLLPRSTVFLEQLARKDILDIFRGLTRTPELQQRYNLSVEDELPVMVADDLLEDKDSPVAPVLQILLTKLWNGATAEDPRAPRFTVAQYQQIKKEGVAMGEFFEQQMAQLRAWRADVVDSGLALDMLYLHTTSMGTAGARSLEELRALYQHRQDIIDSLIAKCKELYLLTDAQHGKGQTALTHDTLAPVVAIEYNNSDRPGQRASRILSNKINDFREAAEALYLDEMDLTVVESGQPGMRKLQIDEEKLLAVSRRQRERRRRIRRRLWTGGILMVLAIIASAVLAYFNMKEAERQANRATSNLLAIKAGDQRGRDLTAAVRVAQAGYHLTPTPSVETVLLGAFYQAEAEQARFYHQRLDHKKSAVDVAVFAPDQSLILTVARDSTARLWNLQGEMLAALRHPKALRLGGFSPDGRFFFTATESEHRIYLRETANPEEIRAVFPHIGRIYQAQFSPDGQYLLSASADRRARIWKIDQTDSSAYRSFPHPREVRAASFSPDGQMLLTVCDDQRIRFWSTAGDSLGSFVHDARINSAAFSRDGRQILSAGDDGLVLLRTLAGDTLKRLDHPQGVTGAILSADGKWLLSAARDENVYLWELGGDSLSGHLQQVLPHGRTVHSLDFSPDGQHFLTASDEKTAYLWPLRAQDVSGDALLQYRILLPHDGGITAAGFSPDGRFILTAARDSSARLWKTEIDTLPIFHHNRVVMTAQFSPDNREVLSAARDGEVALWSAAGEQLQVFHHDDDVRTAQFSPDGKRILTASYDGTARLWSLEGAAPVRFTHRDTVFSAVFSPDGRQILTASYDYTARLWRDNGDSLAIFRHQGKVNTAVFSPDGRQVLTASDDGNARLWRSNGDSLAVLPHDDWVYGAVFSPDGKRLLSYSEDGSARLWSVDGKLLTTFTHRAAVQKALFSPDGQQLLSASSDGFARLWQLDGTLVLKLRHEDGVNWATFSPDGRHILTAADDARVYLWAHNGDLLKTFEHEGGVRSAVFSPDGKWLLTASEDHTARAWLSAKGIADWLDREEVYRFTETEKQFYGIP